ncbi:MAG TPA: hypothetical protein VF559_07670 [Caulobacteraceae bacterium]|jgi:tetratricopeptide (TPR) repeat protein
MGLISDLIARGGLIRGLGRNRVSDDQEALSADRLFLQAGTLLEARQFAQLISLADAMTAGQRARLQADGRLVQLEIWRALTLLRQGKARSAQTAIASLEHTAGASHQTRGCAAEVSLYLGRHAEAAQAAQHAMIGLAPKGGSAQFRALCVLKAEALCAMGRYREASEFLLANLRKKALNAREWELLRWTVRSEADLETFWSYAASYLAKSGPAPRQALYNYSLVCRDLGLFERAVFAAQERLQHGLAFVQAGARKPPRSTSWLEDAKRALLDLKADLSSQGVEFFLISGTLLGCVREGRILGHDKDIDVGLAPGLDKEKVVSALAGGGRFKLKPEQAPVLLRAQHPGGVTIDLFLHWEEDGKLLHGGQKAVWWNSPFMLQETEFLGEAFMIPADHDLYLTENYGDWRTPAPEFETFVDTPNMVVSHEGHMIWYYYIKLFDYYHAGKLPQMRRVWEGLNRLHAPPPQIRRRVENVLREQPC